MQCVIPLSFLCASARRVRFFGEASKNRSRAWQIGTRTSCAEEEIESTPALVNKSASIWRYRESFFCVFATIGFSLLLFFYTVLLHSGNTRCCCILLNCLCVLFLFYNLHASTDSMCSRGLKVILAIELKTERVEVTLVKDGSTEWNERKDVVSSFFFVCIRALVSVSDVCLYKCI